jgi:hypothetical protein
VGDTLTEGEVVGASGASGYGSDWYYGPHAHQTLWPHGSWEDATIDFELYVGEEKDDDMPALHTLTIDLTKPQKIPGGLKKHLIINDDGAKSIFTTPHDVVDGDLYLNIDVTRRPADWATKAAVIQVTPAVENSDASDSHSLGAHELFISTGNTFGHVPLPPVKLGEGRRVRFYIAMPDGYDATIIAGKFRGRYWDE